MCLRCDLALEVKLTRCLGKQGYYGYMYSLVFAADMYATVFKKDPLNPALGEKYKKSILLPGGSREELDSLTVRCARVCHAIGADRVTLQHRNSSVAHRTQRLSRRSCSVTRSSRPTSNLGPPWLDWDSITILSDVIHIHTPTHYLWQLYSACISMQCNKEQDWSVLSSAYSVPKFFEYMIQ